MRVRLEIRKALRVFVSIPDRDFSGLRVRRSEMVRNSANVSIPDRDFSGLRGGLPSVKDPERFAVSIPDRDFSGLRVYLKRVKDNYKCFNP